LLCVTDKTSSVVTIVLITVGFSFTGIVLSGYSPNIIDILPEFTGILMGISNSISTLPGMIGVILTGFILDNTQQNWEIVFLIIAGINTLSVIIYNYFGNDKRLLNEQKTTIEMAQM